MKKITLTLTLLVSLSFASEDGKIKAPIKSKVKINTIKDSAVNPNFLKMKKVIDGAIRNKNKDNIEQVKKIESSKFFKKSNGLMRIETLQGFTDTDYIMNVIYPTVDKQGKLQIQEESMVTLDNGSYILSRQGYFDTEKLKSINVQPNEVAFDTLALAKDAFKKIQAQISSQMKSAYKNIMDTNAFKKNANLLKIIDVSKLTKTDYNIKIASITKSKDGKYYVFFRTMIIMDDYKFLSYNGDIHKTNDIRQKITIQKELSNIEKTSLYNNEKLIMGDGSSKNKLAIFSDPLCIACTKILPLIFTMAELSGDIDIYYYSLPLVGLHPTSEIITLASQYAVNKLGMKHLYRDIYSANFLDIYKKNRENVYSTKDQNKALDIFNKHFKTRITKENLKTQNFNLAYDLSIAKKLRLNGTPSFVFNGRYGDSVRDDLYEYLSGAEK